MPRDSALTSPLPQARLRLLAASLTTTLLAACGGSADDLLGSQPSESAQGCPKQQLSDAWVNNRLSCLRVGQRLIQGATTATGAIADRAFIVQQLTLDASFNNVLPGGASRHFQHFLCVRNAPTGLTDGGNRLTLATDLAVAIGTSNFSSTKPPQVSAISLGLAGGNRPGWVDMPCDPRVHPVIVDFNSRLVESLNPGALTALQVYDL